TVNPDRLPPDLVLHLYLDGRFARSLHISPATFATLAPADEQSDQSPPSPPWGPCVSLAIPADGRVCLAIDLCHLPPNAVASSLVPGPSSPYDANGRVVRSVDPPGYRTPTVYAAGNPAKGSPPPDDAPPDEPHITG